MSERDAWERLGLTPGETVSDEELHAAYRRQAKDAHPDREGGSREEWDLLREAYALMVARGEHIVSDQPEDPGFMSRVVWAWRGWTKLRRIAVILAVGPLVLWWVWSWAYRPPYVPVATSVGLVGYVGCWWVWWIVREGQRRPVKPTTWVLSPAWPFVEIRAVDSPGLVK